MNESLIKDIGRSFIVSSLLPAIFFVLLAVAIFRGFTPRFLVDNLQTTDANSAIYGAGALLLAFMFWIAFLLYSGVDYIVKLYEGYEFPWWLAKPLSNRLWNIQKKKLDIYLDYKEQYEIYLNKTSPTQEDATNIKELREKTLHKLKDGEIEGPIFIENPDMFLPTRLGNVLRSSEIYSNTHYRIDSLTLWPRLAAILPSQFTADLEEKDNQLVFLLNSSLLSYIIGLTSLLLSFFGVIYFSLFTDHPDKAKSLIERGFSILSPNEYLLIGIIFILTGYAIYHVSVNAAEEFGAFIRTGFDLYRFDLLKILNQPIPPNLSSERSLWGAISEFFVASDFLNVKQFTYKFNPDLLKQKTQED